MGPGSSSPSARTGPESSPVSASTASPSGKRSRDPEDEVYLDNLRSHKRYLSEIMAFSLNGLTVGDPLHENIMESPARSDSLLYPRDDLALQYSPMSEDSEDARFCEYPTSTCSSQPESRPTSPVSPYRYPRPLPANSPHPSSHTSTTVASTSQPRQRGSDTEGRFPSSPSDICHSGDLRRAALLRSVQMRAQPSGHGSGSAPNMDGEDRLCFKPLDDDRDYRGDDFSHRAVSDAQSNRSKSRKALDMTVKGDEPFDY
ncbi:PREDICTED: putative protein TPRXL [Tarenaya hassleriana]|uniref:putative protein TPRXL n=1 Tax=Tarenaya hassleriana TaxID=28532 RepID=UPI00053C0AEB|nr:PREDICTED: putative protein TPRXL [Tarenaya hassleriana]